MLTSALPGQVDADAFDAEGAGGVVRDRAGVRRGLLDNYDDVEGYYNFQARAPWPPHPLLPPSPSVGDGSMGRSTAPSHSPHCLTASGAAVMRHAAAGWAMGYEDELAAASCRSRARCWG